MFRIVLAAMVLCAFLIPAGIAGAATTEVSLLNAKVQKIVGTSNITLKGQIEVQNIAYQKQVEVYSVNGIKLATAYYVGTASSGYENWEFATTVTNATGATFYIKYTVNNQTYYDNNGGLNFSISTDTLSGVNSLVLAKSVLITEASKNSSSSIYGTVTLKDYSSLKTVTVVYTTDNWVTSHSVSASFSTPNYAYEKWTFQLTGLSAGQNIKFYVDYTANGVHYYDNNLNRDYTIAM